MGGVSGRVNGGVASRLLVAVLDVAIVDAEVDVDDGEREGVEGDWCAVRRGVSSVFGFGLEGVGNGIVVVLGLLLLSSLVVVK